MSYVVSLPSHCIDPERGHAFRNDNYFSNGIIHFCQRLSTPNTPKANLLASRVTVNAWGKLITTTSRPPNTAESQVSAGGEQFQITPQSSMCIFSNYFSTSIHSACLFTLFCYPTVNRGKLIKRTNIVCILRFYYLQQSAGALEIAMIDWAAKFNMTYRVRTHTQHTVTVGRYRSVRSGCRKSIAKTWRCHFLIFQFIENHTYNTNVPAI